LAEDDHPIYLDHNATTPLLPAVLETMLPFLSTHHGNPSSSHVYGKQARLAVDTAREQVAQLIGCSAAEVVFTSGGTEANNLAILGTAGVSARRRIVTSAVEHPATTEPCAHLERNGWTVEPLPVDAACVVSLDRAPVSAGQGVALLSVILAQNETGTLQPLPRLSDWAHERGALAHTDAAQAVGKVPIRVDQLGVDLLSVAGHKMYAPKGVGALYVRQGVRLEPVLRGAGQERGMRPGTENVASIVGLGAACARAGWDLETEAQRQSGLRDGLWQILRAAIPGIRRNGHPAEVLPNTLNVSFPGVTGAQVLAAAPQIAAATGSACHEGVPDPSSVLLAMGLGPAVAQGAIRLTLGRSTTPAQIETAAAALITGYRQVLARRGGGPG
jgi:cysteine desulfurase